MRRVVTLFAVLFWACSPEVPASPCDDVPITHLGGHMGLSNRAQGLWTNPNVQTDAPDGALHKAENIELDRSGYARPRVGQERLASEYTAGQSFRSGIEYQGYSFEFASATPGGSGTLYRRELATGTLTSVVAMSPPTDVMRLRLVETSTALFAVTSTGVLSADTATSPFVIPGAPQALDPYDIATSGVSGFISTGQSVAYRAVVVERDSAGNDIEGEPSGRVAYTELSPGSFDLQIRLPLRSDAVEGDRLRLYRTTTAAVDSLPGDIMYLAAESVITSPEITAGFKVIIDGQPDILLGAPLYTNPTQEGILYGNRQPPLAKDALVFGEGSGGGQLMLGNIAGPQTLTLRLIATPNAGDRITIAGTTYQADTPSVTEPPTVSAGAVVYKMTSTGSVAEDIRATTLSLVRVINRHPGNTVYARYASSENDPPGIFVIEARTLTTAAFTAIGVTLGTGANYEPDITTAVSSQSDTRPNGVDVSKPSIHYAFPRAEGKTRILVGRNDRSILRMAALRNDVYVFKDGEGIFKLTPIGDGWNVEQMNQEVNLLIPESLAVLDNRIIAYTNRGVVSVDAYGVEEIDLPVKDYTEALATLPAATVQAQTFGVADTTRLCYWLWFPEEAGAESATRALLWNGRASPPAWSERTDAATGGYFGDSGRLYLGDAAEPTVTANRNTGTVDDFQGPDGDAYTVALKWPNRAEGMPGESKQFRQVRLFFERAVGTTATPLPVSWVFTNDYALESPTRTNQVYGLPYSTMEPDPGWQRTSDMGTEVSFPVLRQYVVVKGIEEVVSGSQPVRGR